MWLLVCGVFTAFCFWVNAGHDKTSEFHECDLFPHFLFIYYFGYKIKFLDHNKNIVCDTKTVNNAFSKSTDGGAGRNIADREDRPISILCLYSRKKNSLPPQWWKESNVINLPPGGWLVLLGNVAILGAQLWSLLLTCWHVEPSAIAARSALVRENLCNWAHE